MNREKKRETFLFLTIWVSFLNCSPVFIVEKVASFKEACEAVNRSAYGLQAGVFTNDLNKAFYAYENLEVGGVVINEVSAARVDSMPVRVFPFSVASPPLKNPLICFFPCLFFP